MRIIECDIYTQEATGFIFAYKLCQYKAGLVLKASQVRQREAHLDNTIEWQRKEICLAAGNHYEIPVDNLVEAHAMLEMLEPHLINPHL